MHVPWQWIKQRPHFLAEYLANNYIIDVYYRKPNTVSKDKLLTSVDVSMKNITIKGFNQFPFEKIPVFKYCRLDWLNTAVAYFQLPSFKEYDYIWVTCPALYQAIQLLISDKTSLIYDCMDDMAEFSEAKNNLYLRKNILENEKKLLIRSNHVLCSSLYLKKKILDRAEVTRNDVSVINNAIELPKQNFIDSLPQSILEKINFLKSLPFTFVYVGAISEWFNFELLKKTLQVYPQINFVLIGPCDAQKCVHERIHYLGTVERKFIFSLMQCSYALVMPFKVNELIMSVNPVKLYEYIYAMKPVLSVQYGETEKFSEFVSLFKNDDDFVRLVGQVLVDPQKYVRSAEDINNFITENTWYSRYKQILNILES